MRKLLIVTHIAFWRNGAGHSTRLSSLVGYFNDKISITVVFIGKFNDEDRVTLALVHPGITVDVLEKSKVLTYKESGVLFEAYIRQKTFDVVLVEHIELCFVLPYLSETCITLLDTHDLVHDRMNSFSENNIVYDGLSLTEGEEIEIFNCFDYVIAIQEPDYAKVVDKFPSSRTLLVPHPVNFSKKPLRQTVLNLAFVASGYLPNVDALHWFLREVWPTLHEEYGIRFDVYGNVCEKLDKTLVTNYAGVHFHGMVAELNDVYGNCDVIINPVRFGAGLKIKNVEAIGNGLPLVTTPHGAQGMGDALHHAFLVAETPQEFRSAIGKLIDDVGFRTELGDHAFQHAERFFSHENCYGPLAEVLLGSAGRTSGNFEVTRRLVT